MLADPVSYLRHFANVNLSKFVAHWLTPDGQIAKPDPNEVAQVRMSAEIGKPIAQAYEAGEHDPLDPVVCASYMQLMGEMYCQYLFATETLKIRIEPYFGAGEPYEDSAAMRKDVVRNKHLYFLTTTEEAFGSGQSNVAGNWMGQATGVQLDGYDLLVNDMFRAVHDFFGHAVSGTSFSATGEERAWYCHTRMCTPLARCALTTETRGQNTWVNFGPHMLDDAGQLRGADDKNWLPARDRPFAVQKNMIMPEEVSAVRLYRDDNGIIRAKSLPQALPKPEYS